jgi:hypothetical protein
MYVDVCIQRGLKGPASLLGRTWLDSASIGAVSNWAGSYHVLAMGRHYDDYVISSRILRLPVIPGLPPAHPYERLAGKIRAASVTGNIGEAIAAIVAVRFFGVAIADIAHVRPRRPFRRRKAPDYLMRLGPFMPGVIGAVMPAGQVVAWPDWWPVESKARTTEPACAQARREALRQLIAYWLLLAGSLPQQVGFGVIVTLCYWPPREVRVSIILPSNHASLVSEFANSSQQGPEAERVARWLYDC